MTLGDEIAASIPEPYFDVLAEAIQRRIGRREREAVAP